MSRAYVVGVALAVVSTLAIVAALSARPAARATLEAACMKGAPPPAPGAFDEAPFCACFAGATAAEAGSFELVASGGDPLKVLKPAVVTACARKTGLLALMFAAPCRHRREYGDRSDAVCRCVAETHIANTADHELYALAMARLTHEVPVMGLLPPPGAGAECVAQQDRQLAE